MIRGEGTRYVYVKMTDRPVVHTAMFGEHFDVRVDRDAEEQIVGIEFIGAVSVSVDGELV